MRSAPVRNSVVALAISCIGRLAVAQTPAAPAPAPEVSPPPAPTPPPAEAPPPPPPAPPVLAAPEPQLPPPSPPEPTRSAISTPLAPPAPAPQPTIAVTSKFGIILYGFAELDSIWDSTQSFNEIIGGNPIAHTPGPTTAAPNPATPWAADHGRTQFSARYSRLGLKLKGPDSDNIKTSGQFEFDFFGNQPQSNPTPVAPVGTSGIPTVSENSFYTNATPRIRQAWVKI